MLHKKEAFFFRLKNKKTLEASPGEIGSIEELQDHTFIAYNLSVFEKHTLHNSYDLS
jgi:hypothetical protein